MKLLVAACAVLGAAACGPGPRTGEGGVDAPAVQSDSPFADDSPISEGMTFVYAHTATALYKVDPDTLVITKVGDFIWPDGGSGQMTDLAIDKNGHMLGVTFGAVYEVDPLTASCTLLSSGAIGGQFNGLSFVPANYVNQVGDDVLVGTNFKDGKVYRIDPMTGAAQYAGNMGGLYASSGDMCAVAGFGAVQTVQGAPWDVLVTLDPISFTAHPIGSDTGYGEIWGLGFWKGKVFGFTMGGQFITIDATTGVATLVTSGGPEWWGAAVTTSAPIIE